jgi:hypothetical protein
MLARHPRLAYIHEPFNPGYGWPVTPARFPRQFQLITSEQSAFYAPLLSATLNLYYDLPLALAQVRQARVELARVRGSLYAVRLKMCSLIQQQLPLWRPLVKDPIALLAAEWLAREFSMRVVLLVRQPRGVVSSLLRFPDMITPPSVFVEQPALLAMLPDGLRRGLEAVGDDAPAIDRAILQWRILNYVAHLYRTRCPDFLVVPYEDLARDPVTRFSWLCQQLAIPFTVSMKTSVEHFSQASNPSETNHPGILKRNSRAASQSWKHRLTAEQVAYVDQHCADVAGLFHELETSR